MGKKLLANLSLDLDNQWSYMKTHGDVGWENHPSYYNIFVPHILEILDQLNLKITFFIVGLDADQDENKPFLREIALRGHEIGNHSYHHEVWMNTYDDKKLVEELEMAEQAISNSTGESTVGYRGPGFSWSAELFSTLKEMNYNFDASLLPTYLAPLARYYYFKNSTFTKREKKIRKRMFGTFRDGFKPSRPFYWKLDNGEKLLEIPVSTMPLLKLPFHMSYLLYLGNISMTIMRLYLWLAINMSRLFSLHFSFLLHPLDIIGGDKVDALSFFPGMDIVTEKKVKIFKYVLTKLSKHYEVLPMKQFVDSYLELKGKKLVNKNIPVYAYENSSYG